ncbi:MAG: LysM peptidoglycan-binding domain-containing protein [Chloroflexi bacterium]|nr:LysM peptidoglycan-binding domain-containing protein [Chloroflexota bacterium]
MNWKILAELLLLFALITGLLGFAPGASADAPLTYTVRWGDTLYSIAARYGVSINALMQANNLRDPNFIYIGQRLLISGTAAPVPVPASRYIVQAGDTLFAVATRYGTSVAALMQANGLYNYWIYVGQSLRIPGAPAPVVPVPVSQPQIPAQGVYVTVRPGDYLAFIAAQYGSTVYAIAIANGLSNPSFIYAGQRLFIPSGRAPATAPIAMPAYPIIVPVPPTPTATPTPASAVIYPAPAPNPDTNAWEAVVLTNTLGSGPCWLTAYVVGKTNWPVVVATTDGSFISDPKFTGTKPEKGPYAVEFAHSCTRTWRVIPLGLNIYADVTLNGGHAEVEFHPRSGAAAPAPAPAPAPALASATNFQTTQAPVYVTGKTPDQAIDANNTSIVIGPHAVLWYRLPYGEEPRKLHVWLDTGGKGGVTFEVYSPDSANNLSNAQVTGRGTYNRFEPTHDLTWSGESIIPGIWYVKVISHNDVPTEHSLGYTQAAYSRTCHSYWESLPTGQYVYWTACR